MKPHSDETAPTFMRMSPESQLGGGRAGGGAAAAAAVAGWSHGARHAAY